MDESNIEKTKNKPIIKNEISEKNSSIDIISFVLGIMSIAICWISFYPLVLGFIGIILGIIGVIKKKNERKIAIIGIFLSIIGFIIGILKVMLLIAIIKG